MDGYKEFVNWLLNAKKRLGVEDKANQPTIAVNSIEIKDGSMKKVIEAGTSIELLTPFKDDDSPKTTYVKFQVLNLPDEDDKIMPKHGHGKPSPFGGQKFTIPLEKYLWMTQPGS